MNKASISDVDSTAEARPSAAEDNSEGIQAELVRLRADYEDLKLLYEAMIEHGEAVEDQLAETNASLMRTQARLDAELEEATRYVMSILPDRRTALPLTDWLLVPSTELGGDTFGYHAIDDDHWAVYLLDVCGHGVGAALLSVTAINVLRASALRNTDFREPDQVLAGLNEAFPMEKQNDMFFTIWYGVYQLSTRTLRYSSGGHPPAIHLRSAADGVTQATSLITLGGIAIGAMPGVVYECGSTTMAPGDRILVLSDGTFEVDGPGGDMLDFDDLARFAARESDSPRAILEWVRSHNDGPSLPDDFSLVRVTF